MIKHDSMRGWFAYELYQYMKKNKDIILLTGDLGYGMFDQIRDDMPDQFINCGAAEQAMMGIAVGLALKGKIPFVYSITTFLLYRPFETIRTYVNHEKLNVKLIGSGRDKDYAHDGFSHWSEDAYSLFNGKVCGERGSYFKLQCFFNNIEDYWPQEKEKIPEILKKIIQTKSPCFLSLRR